MRSHLLARVALLAAASVLLGAAFPGCADGPRRYASDGAIEEGGARLDGAREDGGAEGSEDGGAEGSEDAGSTIEDAPIERTDAGTDPGPADTGPPGPACSFEGRTFRLVHLQASMQRTDTVAQRNVSIDAAFDAGADTISWTEIENASDALRIDRRSGWTTFWPSGRPEAIARNAIPISFRNGVFRLERGQGYFASEGRAGVSPSRWVNRVWLRHVPTGLIQSRVSHHAVSGVDGAGTDPVAWRRMTHALDIAKFREVMLIGSVPVVGSGDFNTVRLRTLLGSGFRYDVPSSGGSHGSRLIDWVVRRPHPELAFVSARFITVGNSDHRGVRVAYDYRPRCP